MYSVAWRHYNYIQAMWAVGEGYLTLNSSASLHIPSSSSEYVMSVNMHTSTPSLHMIGSCGYIRGGEEGLAFLRSHWWCEACITEWIVPTAVNRNHAYHTSWYDKHWSLRATHMLRLHGTLHYPTQWSSYKNTKCSVREHEMYMYTHI